MSHIVFIPGSVRAKLITATPFADRLDEEGHRVTMLIPPTDLPKPARMNAELEDLRIGPPDWQLPSSATVAAFQRRLEALSPDLVLIDNEALPYILAARATDLPVALLSVFFNLWKRPGVPPVHVDIMPGEGLAGTRIGIELAWHRYRASRLAEIAFSRDREVRALKSFAVEIGTRLDGRLAFLDGLQPFLFRDLPTLTLNLEELEFPNGVDKRCFYVGPMPRASGKTLSDTDRAAIEAVAAFRQRHEGRKTVYCAFGSYFPGNDLALWHKAAQAIGSRNDWVGVFGLGGRISKEDLGALPENILALDWAPQAELLEIADCAVLHGGMTSIYEAIAKGVPIVSYPYREIFDQFGTAHRVRYRGIGLVGNKQGDSAAVIAQKIESALADEGIKSRLHQMKGAMQRYRDQKRLSQGIDWAIRQVGSRQNVGTGEENC